MRIVIQACAALGYTSLYRLETTYLTEAQLKFSHSTKKKVMANSSLPPSSLLLILLFGFFSNAFNSPSAMDCNSSDRAALLKIKEQLGNPPELSSWLPAMNCCAWDNTVICSETGRVYLVALFRLNATAPIPSAYGDLPMLQTIQLDAMPGLYGPIPSSFAKLSHLELLDITGTQSLRANSRLPSENQPQANSRLLVL